MSTTINLETEIVRENEKLLAVEEKHLDQQAKLDAEVEAVLAAADSAYRESLMGELGFDYKLAEAQRIRQERQTFANLPQNRVMNIDAIKNVCLKYQLRFLPTRFYRGKLDAGIGPKLAEFKAKMGGNLPAISDPECLATS